VRIHLLHAPCCSHVVEGILDAVLDATCLGQARSEGYGPARDLNLLGEAPSVLDPASSRTLQMWTNTPRSLSSPASFHSLFTPFLQSNYDEMMAIDGAAEGDELYFSNTDYSVLWEFGHGRDAVSTQDSWRSWIPETSLASVGFGLARLVCDAPISTVIMSRVSSLVDTLKEVLQAANDCSRTPLTPSSPTTSDVMDRFENWLNAGMSDVFAMAWQGVRNVLVLLKVRACASAFTGHPLCSFALCRAARRN
jgi:hypothetical protein